jgi:hypothetical protein
MNLPSAVYSAINNDPHWGPLYRGLQKGTVTHKQIEDEVRALHIGEYTAMLKRWMEGTLFFSQKAAFDAWLDVDEQTYQTESEQANHYLGFEAGCSEPYNEDIHNFINRRIYKLGIGRRKEIGSNGSKREACRDFWRKENIKYRWDW